MNWSDAPGGFWSFSGATHEDRRDWVQPLKADFDQRNSLSMAASDYGGGIPMANIWRRDVGLAVGHVEPMPRLLDLPVRKTANGASIAIESAQTRNARARPVAFHRPHLHLSRTPAITSRR